MKKIILLMLLIMNVLAIKAHQGSHEGFPLSTFRTWRFQDKSLALDGYFVCVKAGKVLIENDKGAVQAIDMKGLSWIDQQYVNRKIATITSLNRVEQEPSNQQKSSLWHWGYVLLFVGFIALLLKYQQISFVFLSLGIVLVACKKEEISTSHTTPVTSTNTDPLLIEESYAMFKPAIATRWDNTYFYIESTGIPAHEMMKGITSWQQQVPISQNYKGTNAWSIPLKPELATSPMSIKTNFMKGAIAIAANGIPIFNPLNNRGEDSYVIGELDQWGGHCGRADDYHYHIPPTHLETVLNTKAIAWALDGFAVYGSKEPDGSTMKTLDENHGHTGINGVYHYHATTTFPYMIGAMRGKVTIDPTTPAPENQILPQAFATPIRPALTALKGASITSLTAIGSNAYSLEYVVNAKKAYVNYSWDNAKKYTFIFIDPDGISTTQTYQGK